LLEPAALRDGPRKDGCTGGERAANEM